MPRGCCHEAAARKNQPEKRNIPGTGQVVHCPHSSVHECTADISCKRANYCMPKCRPSPTIWNDINLVLGNVRSQTPPGVYASRQSPRFVFRTITDNYSHDNKIFYWVESAGSRVLTRKSHRRGAASTAVAFGDRAAEYKRND